LPLLLLAGHWRLLRTHAGAIFVSGLLSSALPFALFAWALLSISTGLSAILNATTPLFGALVAWLWLRERLPAGRALGLAVGFAGVLLLSWPKADFAGGGTGWAVLACLGATLCYGLAASHHRRYLSDVPPLVIAGDGRPLRRVAWCSGGAQGYFEQAIALGADVYLSGEISEQTVHLARESGVAYVAAGHHATERYGVQALAAHLAARFGLECEFVDIDNPV